MAEKDKSSESMNGSGSNLQRYPSKDQIIARLVQIRECTAKAEETLHNMPPNAQQNDPKFYQLQEMLSEMKEAEKRLLDILGDYEAGASSPIRSRYSSSTENHQVLQQQGIACANIAVGEIEDMTLEDAETLNAVAPILMSEREALKQRCLESEQRIEMLEKQRKLLMEACSRSSERGKSVPPLVAPYGESSDDVAGEISKRMQVVREADSSVFSQRCSSNSALIVSEALAADTEPRNSNNLSELADKRLEIHSIISEIALLRRAKDESARKIELLQQALKRSEECGGDVESGRLESSTVPPPPPAPPVVPVKTDSVEYLDELSIMERDSSSDDVGVCSLGPAEWMATGDSFTDTITRKLMEIQTMRQKLDTLQSLVHNIPTPGSYQQQHGLENEVEILSMMKGGNSDSVKETASSARLSSSMFNLPDRNLDFTSRYKSGSSTSARSSFAGDVVDVGNSSRNRCGKKTRSRGGLDQTDDFDRNSQRSMLGCSNEPGADSPPPRQVRPVPIRAHPSGYGDSPLVFPGLPRSDRDESTFLSKSTAGNDRHPSSYLSHSNHDFLPPSEGMIGSSALFDSGRQWTAFQNPSNVPAFTSSMNHNLPSSSGPATNNYGNNTSQVESFIIESNGLLKHLVRCVEVISTGLENQGKQIGNLKESIDRLTSRFGGLPCGDVENERLRRNNVLPDSLPEMLPNMDGGIDSRGCDHVYQGSRQQNFQDMNYSYGQVKGVNPAREVWGANYNASSPCTSYPAEQLNNVGLHEDNNVGVGTSSAFYSPNPSSYNSKIKRPWVSPGSLEPSRLMLNNQVAPGNRTNNYWDNFRSQSRQNVLSSSSKSNESFNAAVAAAAAIDPEAAHAQASGVSSTNNFNRLEFRHDKNPGARPIKAVMMKHFVENIGSKKRNEEQHGQQQLPQRSVSVGSMPHTLDSSRSHPTTSSRHVRHNGLNDLSMSSSSSRVNKEGSSPGDHMYPQASSKLTRKEANVMRQAQQSQDCLKEMYAKVSQLQNELIRQRTLDTLRNLVQQSVLQDQMIVEGLLEEAVAAGAAAATNAANNRHNTEDVVGGLSAAMTTRSQQPPPISSAAARAELHEILWADPFSNGSSSSSRLLPYAGISGASLGNSQSSNEMSRREHLNGGEAFTGPADSFVNSSSSSRSLPLSSSSRRSEPIEVNGNYSSNRGRIGGESWISSSSTAVQNETSLPSLLQSENKNCVGTSKQDTTISDIYESGDPFSALQNQQSSSCLQQLSDASSSADRYHREVVKSLAEGEYKESSSSGKKPDSDSAKVTGGKSQDKALVADGGSAVKGAKEQIKGGSSTTTDGSLQALTFNPLLMRENTSGMEADLDASLLNISGTAFLAEPSSPESSSPVTRSFCSSVQYKGREMDDTNNPWVMSPLHGNKSEEGQDNLTQEAKESTPLRSPENLEQQAKEDLKSNPAEDPGEKNGESNP